VAMPAGALLGFLDPRHLDRLEDLLSRALRIVVEAVQRHHLVAQLDEVDALRIDLGMLLGQRDRDVLRVDPLHFRSLQYPYFLLSLTWFNVYFGISMVSGTPSTRAWQESREVSSRPHALSRRSSSLSVAVSRDSKPSRTITWHVVQAHDFSQACSISIPFSSSVSHSVLPGSAS